MINSGCSVCFPSWIIPNKAGNRYSCLSTWKVRTRIIRSHPSGLFERRDQKLKRSANIDLYDDAILDYDDEVNELVQNLKNDGQYDNTLLDSVYRSRPAL